MKLDDKIVQSVQDMIQQRGVENCDIHDEKENGCIPTDIDMPSKHKDNSFSNVNSVSRSASHLLNKLPGALPNTVIQPAIDHVDIASTMVKRLNSDDPGFAADAVWRDIFALTGNLRTFYGAEKIFSSWQDVVLRHQADAFKFTPSSSKIVQMGPDHAWISARFTFTVSSASKRMCSGEMGLVPFERGWKIWYLTTLLEELFGYPNPDYMTARGINSVTTTHESGADYECVVVGAGFAGLCLAGRLKAMGIHYLVIDRHSENGASWKERYDSLRLHTTKYYSDFPFSPVLRDQAEYFPKSCELVEGYREYVRRHELNVQLSSLLTRADFDDKTKVWTLHLNHDGESVVIRTLNIVFAIGGGGSIPIMPQVPKQELYQGTAIHSASYKNSHDCQGKTAVVIGSANTAHDIAEDMLAAGVSSITMLQRSKTPVFSVPWFTQQWDMDYNPTLSVEEGDRREHGMPLALVRHMSHLGQQMMFRKFGDHYDAVEKAGFKIDRDAEILAVLTDRFGGHHMDVGASHRIADGSIHVKSGVTVTEFSATGVNLSDGSALDADVIIFCTGFKLNVRDQITEIIGPCIGEKLDDYWGLDEEGEVRGAYRPHKVPGIYFTGGGVDGRNFDWQL